MMEGSGGEVPKAKLDEMLEAEVRDVIAAAMSVLVGAVWCSDECIARCCVVER